MLCYHRWDLGNTNNRRLTIGLPMKLSFKFIAAICLLTFLVSAAAVGWFLYDMSREMSPATYARWLDADSTVYATVDSIDETQLQRFAYAYDENEFVNAIPNAARLPKIADANGNIPAFKLGDDTFVITWKWVNSSAGLAISDSQNFKSKIESLDHCFRVRHLSGSIYEWELDLEAPYPD